MGGVLIVVGPVIHDRPTPDAAQLEITGQAITASIAYPYAKLILGSLPVDDHVHQLTG